MRQILLTHTLNSTYEYICVWVWLYCNEMIKFWCWKKQCKSFTIWHESSFFVLLLENPPEMYSNRWGWNCHEMFRLNFLNVDSVKYSNIKMHSLWVEKGKVSLHRRKSKFNPSRDVYSCIWNHILLPGKSELFFA